MIARLEGHLVILKCDERASFGFGVYQSGPGVFEIANIILQGAAYRNGMIRLGDIVTSINGQLITEDTTMNMFTDMMRKSEDTVKLILSSRPHLLGR